MKLFRINLITLTILLVVHKTTGNGLFDNILSQILPNSIKNSEVSPTASTDLLPLASTTSSSIHHIWNPFGWFQGRSSVPTNYNPDTDLTTCEIAARHNYPSESHVVKTEDGYLLTLHRIPCGRKGCINGRGRGQPVFLQHGLLASSADWLLSGPEKALAFILADLGYDVWLGNARGNTYSKRHINMSNEDANFWDFSWHEMAKYDIPAEIDYVYTIRFNEIGESGPKEYNMLYIGHSMGTTMAFALCTMRPEYNLKIKAIFALAPIAYMTNVKSPIRLLAPFSKDIEIPALYRFLKINDVKIPKWVDVLAHEVLKHASLNFLMIVRFFGANEFLPQNKIIRFLAKYGCEMTDAERYICENTVFVLCGFDKSQYNATLMPVIFGHTPAGTSTKTVVHYAQEIHESGNFQYFDYGTKENTIRYGQETPPHYDVENVTVPVALFYATNDWLAGPQDVAKLFDKLHKTSIGMFKVPYENFNHVDFMWGNDAPKFVYSKLIEIMERY